MPLETIIAGVMVASLVLYALLGGADYGGGVWDLFAFGRRAREQRALIAEAISPVWEANHVWLILVVVILFTAFPPAFAAIATALNVPITLLLIGIVLRGAAFTFRTYDVQHDNVQRRWSLVFSVASIITPILLGTTLGAIASGTIRVGEAVVANGIVENGLVVNGLVANGIVPSDLVANSVGANGLVVNGVVANGFFRSWLAPFPLAVGFFALALFAFLAAVYLTVEAEQRELQEAERRGLLDVERRGLLNAERGELQEDFRLRALAAGVVVGLLALTVFVLAKTGAPTVRAGISRTWWALGLHFFTAIFATGAFVTLWTRRYRIARVCAAAQVTLILLGWAFAQFPHLVEPDITITSAAAPQITLELLLAALAAGALLLFPSYYYLFRIFKAE